MRMRLGAAAMSGLIRVSLERVGSGLIEMITLIRLKIVLRELILMWL